MRQWVIMFCLLTILSFFCFGCSWTMKESSKGTMIRCPKCGAFYSSKEGAETFEWMRGGLKDTRK
jgi:tRNA(Ile2) C34 agmatinyltransferase TiaS